MCLTAQARLQTSWQQWINLRQRVSAGPDSFFRAIESSSGSKDLKSDGAEVDPSNLSSNRQLEFQGMQVPFWLMLVFRWGLGPNPRLGAMKNLENQVAMVAMGDAVLENFLDATTRQGSSFCELWANGDFKSHESLPSHGTGPRVTLQWLPWAGDDGLLEIKELMTYMCTLGRKYP